MATRNNRVIMEDGTRWGFRREGKYWVLVSPDGYERYHEGNWMDFVPYANLILENHGYDRRLS